MFSQDETLYINAIKYDTQLKLDYKKLNHASEIISADNSIFLVNDDILIQDIIHKINSLQEEVNKTYISTILLSDTTRLVPKNKSQNLKDCEIAHFNDNYDIAVLKTTLFETKHYFEKTGIDYIYSAFHILNLHLEQNMCRNEFLVFLFNNRAFILILDDEASIVFNKTLDLPTFEGIKKTHFYDDDIFCQNLYDEIYYLELSKIIKDNLEEFYGRNSNTFVNKVSILYAIKQLSNENIESLREELLLNIDYNPINIDEKIFELSKDKHQKQSFVKPRNKKEKKQWLSNFFIFIFLLLFSFGAYNIYLYIENVKVNNKGEVKKGNVVLPNHININDKIQVKVKKILDSIPYDVVLDQLKIDRDTLFLKGEILRDDTFVTSLKPILDEYYEKLDINIENKDKKIQIPFSLKAKGLKELENIEYKKYEEKYIVDEFFPISRVTEQLTILMPENTIIKFKNSKNDKITKFNYLVNIQAQSPNEFFRVINILNNELYSININYPISINKINDNLEIEFDLSFNQIKE
ncbi:MAG: hypothetical protein KGV43_03350 [Arcobacter sp.]|nr:hypothetical protein [Arcobacter sp.]